MKQLINIRQKWDNLFKDQTIDITVKILGMIFIFISIISIIKISPFSSSISFSLILLISFVIGIVFLINEMLCNVIFAIFLAIFLVGGNAFLAFIAGMVCLLACTSPKIIQILVIITPWLVMNIESDSGLLTTCGLGYLIYFVSIYFNEKIAATIWRYAYPVYFTVIAYNFNLYGQITTNNFEEFISGYNGHIIQEFIIFADYENAVIALNYNQLVIVTLVNILVCYMTAKIISSENLKFLRLPIDIRDLIAFGVGIISCACGIFVLDTMSYVLIDTSLIYLILQGLTAYILTRPFASNQACEQLKISYVKQQKLNHFLIYDYEKNAKETLENILKTYWVPSIYRSIISAGKFPINVVLIIGESDLDKKLVLKNFLDDISINAVCQDGNDFAKKNMKLFSQKIKNEKLTIILMNDLEKIVSNNTFSHDEQRQQIKYIKEIWETYKDKNNVIFISTSSRPDLIPDELFGSNMINKIIHVNAHDSMLLNGTYRLIGQIGKGGGGIVYKAIHERLNVIVAVKRITHQFSTNITYKTEAEILKKIKHESLPKIYDVFEEKGEYYTVMDYIYGKNLQQIIDENGALAQEDVLKWGIQLADAVSYLHEQEKAIIHSDIKPSNIILTHDNKINLIDFNISLVFQANVRKGIGVTPGFSPIEQYGNVETYINIVEKAGITRENPLNIIMKGHEETLLLKKNEAVDMYEKKMELYAKQGISEKSDIYSLGATMYALLTGETPSIDFNGIKSLSAYNLKINKDLIVIIEKAMEINADDRYSTAKELKAELVNIAETLIKEA